jgi:hypothetical protein
MDGLISGATEPADRLGGLSRVRPGAEVVVASTVPGP